MNDETGGSFRMRLEDAKHNDNYRTILHTCKFIQAGLMSLKPGENIGKEKHEAGQVFIVVEGSGRLEINGSSFVIMKGDLMVVDHGEEHDIINTDMDVPMKLFTLYSPPMHPSGTVEKVNPEDEEMDSKGEPKMEHPNPKYARN